MADGISEHAAAHKDIPVSTTLEVRYHYVNIPFAEAALSFRAEVVYVWCNHRQYYLEKS